MKPLNALTFNHDWNKKLQCDHFTTLRLRIIEPGTELPVYLKNDYFDHVTVLDRKSLKLDQINNWIAYLDTGYDAAECMKILTTMYKNKNVNWKTQTIYFYLLKRHKN